MVMAEVAADLGDFNTASELREIVMPIQQIKEDVKPKD